MWSVKNELKYPKYSRRPGTNAYCRSFYLQHFRIMSACTVLRLVLMGRDIIINHHSVLDYSNDFGLFRWQSALFDFYANGREQISGPLLVLYWYKVGLHGKKIQKTSKHVVLIGPLRTYSLPFSSLLAEHQRLESVLGFQILFPQRNFCNSSQVALRFLFFWS
jgi:hypothetical protein